MIVTYNHYLYYVVGAAKIVRPEAFSEPLTFTLEHYIKSQIHLQVVHPLFGRDIMKYNYANDYMQGDDSRLYEFSLVLRYFYQDHAALLCNLIKAGIDQKISIDTKVPRQVDLPHATVSMASVRQELSDVLGDNLREDAAFALGIISKFEQKEIPTLQSSDLLALASICWYYGDTSKESMLVDISE